MVKKLIIYIETDIVDAQFYHCTASSHELPPCGLSSVFNTVLKLHKTELWGDIGDIDINKLIAKYKSEGYRVCCFVKGGNIKDKTLHIDIL